MNKIVLAYVPVIHQGYINFFENYPGTNCLVIGRDVAYQYRPLEKDIRAVDPKIIKKMIEQLDIFNKVEVADEKILLNLKNTDQEIVMPDEDYMHILHQKYFPDAKVTFVNVFLRWDKDNAARKYIVNPDHKVSKEEFDKIVIKKISKDLDKVSCWYRQIGAAIVKDGQILISGHNQHVPHPQMPYVNGDPRASFNKGVQVELSTVLHGEALMIAEAARRGISVEGASLYTTTFPCPPCAKQVAFSGIKKLYYQEGYAVLDGESILKSQGVEIIRVE